MRRPQVILNVFMDKESFGEKSIVGLDYERPGTLGKVINI